MAGPRFGPVVPHPPGAVVLDGINLPFVNQTTPLPGAGTGTLAGGTFLVCPVCFTARSLDDRQLIKGAALGGTVPLWEWIGDEGATTFSY